MENKKSKFLFYISCLLLFAGTGIFFAFQSQPAYVAVGETSACKSESIFAAKEAQNFLSEGEVENVLAGNGIVNILSEREVANVASANEAESVLAEDDIFEDYTQTSLNKEYADRTILDQLKQENKISEQVYERATMVLDGNVRYTSKREFSTEFENDNKIDQVGDIAQYSQTALKCIWKSSEIILTGIYGMPDFAFNVFVEADETTNNLPSIMFSQNHGYYLHWYNKVQLKKGWNKLTFPTFGLGYIAKDEIRGGAVYLCNPYLPEEQGKISVYIEGGDFYPIFRKGGNEQEFLNFLEEYETQRAENNLLNMAELVTDHAIISTTSSSLYDVYFNNNVITPSENLNLWGNYFTTLFEFNGIPTSESSNLDVAYDPRNDYVKINFRYMTYYEGSGAYSYSYHIGWYYEHYWFANFYNAKNPIKDHGQSEHLLFGIGHELGHALDNDPRKINETTNNFTAAMAYFNIVGMPHHEQYQPFAKTLKALSNDYKLDHKAYDDGQIMYTKDKYPTIYDHNYLIWWDLEAVFPGFWARFNNYFRGTIESELSMEEKYVYYSSIATQVDLSDYYERWGFYYGKSPGEWSHRFVYSTSSEKFKSLMEQARQAGKISKKFDHFWYADGTQYDFALSHQNVPDADRAYKGAASITKIIKSNSKRTIYIQGMRDENHLCYEIYSKVGGVWKLAGFTYGSSFVDENYYSSDPIYKVVAINRFFNQSEPSQEFSDVSLQSPSVCRIEEQYFNSIHEALERATNGQTIFLLADCKLEYIYLLKNVTIEIDSSIQNDICIDTNQTFLQCQSELTIKGKTNAKIIFDGNVMQTTNPLIFGASAKFTAENVVFRNMRTKFLAGVIYAPGMDVELSNCSFENCIDLKGDGIICAGGKVRLENCTFTQIEEPCVNISNIDNLTLSQKVNNISVRFDDFDDVRSIKLEGNFTQDVLEKIEINADYMLKFDVGGIFVSKILYRLKFYDNKTNFECEIKSHEFEFGTEQHEYNLLENQYVEYEERLSGRKYQTGDKIVINKDSEFNVTIKDKLSLEIFYKNEKFVNYYAYAYEVYLPTIDNSQNKVVAYRDGDKIYDAGQTFVLEKQTRLVAIYEGCFVYRYIVRDAVFSVGYGVYGQSVNLLQLDEEGFLGWQYDTQIVLGSVLLKGDAAFIAVFSTDLPKIYDLEKCEIRVEGTYTYSGEAIVPKIVVYFNAFVVPENCYRVSCSNNISASERAEIEIASVDGRSTGSKTQFFTIRAKQLGLNDINVSGLRDFVYNGSQTEQNLTITHQNAAISNFSIEYIGDRTNAGRVQVKISFFGNFCGNVYLKYTISKADRDGFGVWMGDWTYGENAPSPQVQNKKEDATISFTYSTSRNGDYTSEMPTDAGSYWIKAMIEPSQNYNSAEAYASFTIAKANNPPQMPPQTMTVGRKIKTLQLVELNGGWKWENPNTEIVAESTKAFAVYFDTKNYINYRVEITIIKVAQKDASLLSITLETQTFVYDGTVKTPKVIAKDGGLTLSVGIDYDVQYQNNKLAGQGKAIVTFKTDYKGSKELLFTISKASKPNVDTIIRINKKATKLSDIPLPNGFVWKDESVAITQNMMSAKAVYVGEDKDCYLTQELYFTIIIDSQSSVQSIWLWLAIGGVTLGLLLVWAGFAFARYRHKKWWKNK